MRPISEQPEHIKRLFAIRKSEQRVHGDDVNDILWRDTNEEYFWMRLYALNKRNYIMSKKLYEVLYDCNVNEIIADNEAMEIDFIDFAHDDPTKLSYMMLSKWDEGVDPYDHTKRIMAKPGKVLKKILPTISDHEIECIVNVIKAKMTPDTFSIVSGEDIRSNYDGENYADGCGSLNNSCMRHERCQEYLSIYVDNPDVVKMLVSKNCSGKVTGRALLWYVDGKIYMDRIYGSDSTIAAFIAYAKSNGIIRKECQSYSNETSWVTPDDLDVTEIFTIELKYTTDREFPYMDTFKYIMYERDDKIGLSNDSTDYIGRLCNTDGTIDGYGDYIIAVDTGNRISEEDAYYVERYGDYYQYANFSQYYREYIPENDSIYSEILNDYLWEDRHIETDNGDIYPECYRNIIYLSDCDSYFHIDDVVFSEKLDEYIPADAAAYCEDIKDYIRKGNAYEIDGKYYYKEPVNELENV